jgi:tetratricopeptide (TPR) repeat protein
MEELATDFPGAPQYREDWAVSLLNLGEVHRNTGQYQEADRDYRQAAAILREQTRGHRRPSTIHGLLASALGGRAKLCRDRDDVGEARHLFGEALAHQKTAVEQLGPKTNPPDQAHLAIRSLELADTLLQLSRDPPLMEQVEELVREAVRGSSGDWSSENALAWFLATCAEPRFRDPQQAVALAKRLVERDPSKATCARTLAAALYAMEDWTGAIAAADKAMQLPHGDDATERFFRAMAHWRLGKQEEARADYERAVAWMEQHQRQHYELRRLRAEAAALLGIHEQPAKKPLGISQ